MTGPWEKYATPQAAAPAGPWTKYAPQQEEDKEPQWSDLPGNILPSAGEAIKNTASALNPMNWDDIASNLYELGPSGIAQFFKDRYGGADEIKKTLITDPAGVLLDASTLLTGGGAAAARAPGMVGKIGAAAAKTGKHIDPIMGTVPEKAAGYLAKKAGGGASWVGSNVLGMTTGAGRRSIEHAASAGFEGGDKAKAFREHITGKAKPEESVFAARGAAEKIRHDRALEYQDGIRHVLADKTPLDFTKIDAALTSAKGVDKFKKTSLGSPKTVPAVSAMTKAVNQWKRLAAKDPDYRTMAGFDALKKKLNNIRLSTDARTPARVAADRIFHGVRRSIIDLSKSKPVTVRGKQMTYADVMKAYDDATDTLDELTKTMSLGDTSTIDSALRKLQSIMRDTAHTNYGARVNLVQMLVDNGAENLMYELAGQTLRPGLRPGLASQVGVAGVGAGIIGLGLPLKSLVVLTSYSPRLMGEATYAASKAAAIGKSVVGLQRFMDRRGLSFRGVGLAGQQAEKISEAGSDQKQFKNALAEQAQKLGYKLHPSVLDRLAADLVSEDREIYERGIRTIASNPRIRQMILEEAAE